MKILGLRFCDGLPIMDMLCTYYDNSKNENYIEIARRYWKTEPNKYKAIILLWRNEMNVYNERSFQ